jgi:hypothetical protein
LVLKLFTCCHVCLQVTNAVLASKEKQQQHASKVQQIELKITDLAAALRVCRETERQAVQRAEAAELQVGSDEQTGERGYGASRVGPEARGRV